MMASKDSRTTRWVVALLVRRRGTGALRPGHPPRFAHSPLTDSTMTRASRIAFALLPLAGLATGLSAQVGSPAGPVPVEYLTARRADLLKRMGNGIAIIRSSEQRSIEGDYPRTATTVNNDFFYLTGLETPSSGWCWWRATPSRRRLSLPAGPRRYRRWTGARWARAGGVGLTGIEGRPPRRPGPEAIRAWCAQAPCAAASSTCSSARRP
jgi:hypothetical protein